MSSVGKPGRHPGTALGQDIEPVVSSATQSLDGKVSQEGCRVEQGSRPDGQKWEALLHGLEARDRIALEVMREVFARLPYGQEFRLSDGSVARLEKLAEPELCRNDDRVAYPARVA